MSASALCIHVGMSACFARPFVHQSVASARLSVRLMIVYHCAHRFIFSLSICLIFRPSVCMSVCMYVHMYLCRDELSGHRKLNWLDWYFVWLVSSLDTHFIWLFCFFSCRGSNDGIAGMCTFLCKNCVYDRQKSTHIFVSDSIVLFHKSFMTVTNPL